MKPISDEGMSHLYKIREICGDWALDMVANDGSLKTIYFFNSRQNALFVQKILECDDMYVAADKAPVVRCHQCRFWVGNGSDGKDCKWRKDETPGAYDYCSFDEYELDKEL